MGRHRGKRSGRSGRAVSAQVRTRRVNDVIAEMAALWDADEEIDASLLQVLDDPCFDAALAQSIMPVIEPIDGAAGFVELLMEEAGRLRLMHAHEVQDKHAPVFAYDLFLLPISGTDHDLIEAIKPEFAQRIASALTDCGFAAPGSLVLLSPVLLDEVALLHTTPGAIRRVARKAVDAFAELPFGTSDFSDAVRDVLDGRKLDEPLSPEGTPTLMVRAMLCVRQRSWPASAEPEPDYFEDFVSPALLQNPDSDAAQYDEMDRIDDWHLAVEALTGNTSIEIGVPATVPESLAQIAVRSLEMHLDALMAVEGLAPDAIADVARIDLNGDGVNEDTVAVTLLFRDRDVGPVPILGLSYGMAEDDIHEFLEGRADILVMVERPNEAPRPTATMH